MKITQHRLMFSALVLGLALSFSGTVRAVGGFSQAPAAGNDTSGAQFLITWNGTSFSVATASPNPGPYDGIEDTLYGVQNNSGAPLLSLTITGSNIFGFDGDGVSTYTGLPSGSSGYEGSISATSTFDPSGALDSFNVIDNSHGSVIFGATGIAAGGSAYFSLEENASVVCNTKGCSVGAPDTGSTLSLMAIACAVGLTLKRRFCRA